MKSGRRAHRPPVFWHSFVSGGEGITGDAREAMAKSGTRLPLGYNQ